MRSIVVAAFIFAMLPVILMKPHVGVLMFSWVSYMNPHRLTYGFAYSFPFAFIIAALTMVAWFVSKESKALPLNTINVLILLLLVWMSVTTAFAWMPDDAFLKWKEVTKILVMTFMTTILINDRKRVEAMSWVIFLSIGFFAIKGGIFTILTGGSHRIYGPPSSLIEENNALALATIMVIPLGVYLMNHAPHKFVRWAMMGALPVMFFSVVASYSRGAFLAMGAMVLVMWFKSKKKLISALALVVIVGAVFSFMPDKYFDRLDTLNTYEEDASAMSRINAWTMALNLAIDNPIMGGGFGVFGVEHAWSQYAPVPEDMHNAHSIYFEVLAFHGFVGLGLFLAIFVMAYRNGSHIVARCKKHPTRGWMAELTAMIQVSMLGFAVGGTFLNLAFYDLFWNFVAFQVILMEILRREVKAEEEQIRAAKAARARGETVDEDGGAPMEAPQVSIPRSAGAAMPPLPGPPPRRS